MTTNQTIDGVLVSRETLQKWLDDIGPSRHVTHYAALKRDELRALLDAPATWVCNSCKVEQPTDRACDVCNEQTKPAAHPPNEDEPVAYCPGLYAVRHIDNCVGERDIVLSFARLDATGKWTYEETGGDLLTYRGDKVLKAWPIDCTEAPDVLIEGRSNE